MGYWKTSMGAVGDGPADIMGEAIEELRQTYRTDLGREPSRAELHAVLAFVLAPLDDLSADVRTASTSRRNASAKTLRAEIHALRSSLEIAQAHNRILREDLSGTANKMLLSALVGGVIGCAIRGAGDDNGDPTPH